MDYVQNQDDQAVVLDRVKDPPIADADPIQIIELLPYKFLAAARSGFERQPPNSSVNSTEKLAILS